MTPPLIPRHARAALRFLRAGLPALLLVAASRAVAAAPEPPAKELATVHLNVGFPHRAFAGINRNDVETALKACLVTFGRERGYDTVLQCDVFDTTSAFEAAIRKGALHMQIIPTWEYVTMDIQEFTDPYFVPLDQASVQKEYLLLTKRDSGIATLADLRSQTITLLESANVYSSRPWVETILLRNRLGRPEDFFGRVTVASKPSLAVLPVFFGQQQACVVNRSAFEVIKDLNPQIGQRLRILTSSKPILGAVFCLKKAGWESATQKEDTIQALADLHTTPAGQQMLTLFKLQKFLPFKAEYLENVRQLKSEHDRLAEAANATVRPSAEWRNAP